MVPNPAHSDGSLQLKRTFAAPRARVFRAWTDPAELKKWWGPHGYTTPSAEVDLRVGGAYRLAMKPPEGTVFYLSGTYREVRPPERLVYTWNWEKHDMTMGETVVTVEFLDRGGSTEVVLTHEFFPNAARRDGHQKGWTACLERLEQAL